MIHAHKRTHRSQTSDFRVRLIYNEQVLPIPRCSSNSDGEHSAPLDCDLQTFLDVTEAASGGVDMLDQLCEEDGRSSAQIKADSLRESLSQLGGVASAS